MNPIELFAHLLNSNISFKESLIVKSHGRYFLLNEALKHLASKDFFYAGMYLGKQRDRVFFPSFNLLAIIAKARGNEVIVDEKTEWLFICGRDIFKRGIISVTGSLRKGNYTLVLNSHRECLGFGETLCDLSEARNGVAVKNVLDLGDFLRREKSDPRKRS